MQRYLLLMALCLLFGHCKDPYFPAVVSDSGNHLVVEGNIAGGDSALTVIRLSRSTPINDTARLLAETGAVVSVETEDGNIFPLEEKERGHYTGKGLALREGSRCRLRITTAAKSEYLSDFVPFKISPPIDSIGYNRYHDGVQVYVSTHDARNESRYYRWEYDATWEYHSPLLKRLRYEESDSSIRVASVEEQEKNYRCWQTERSTSIIIASSDRLGEDRIHQAPLIFIPPENERLTTMYSPLVRQYVLTREAYDYWVNVKKVTEDLGSFFGPLPAELKGNIHCISNPGETVIGYISASTVAQKRGFISRPADWRYFERCSEELDTISVGRFYPKPLKQVLQQFFGGRSPARIPFKYLGDPPYFNTTPIIAAYGPACVICTTRGGTNVRPDYWP